MKHLSYGKIVTRIALSAQDQNIHRHLKMIYIKYTISRAWYNGSTSASQAEDEGSIPFARTRNQADQNGRFYLWLCGDGREPDTKGSERSVSAVKGAQQNHQEFYDWFDFAWELYIPFARTRNQADQNGRFYF